LSATSFSNREWTQISLDAYRQTLTHLDLTQEPDGMEGPSRQEGDLWGEISVFAEPHARTRPMGAFGPRKSGSRGTTPLELSRDTATLRTARTLRAL